MASTNITVDEFKTIRVFTIPTTDLRKHRIISSRAKTENNPYVLVKHCTEHAVDLPPDGDTDSTTVKVEDD